MRKVIAAINMTLDGFCDHTAIIPDEELHSHYAHLLEHAAVILYGRITFQLMEYWPTVVKNPTGHKDIDEFALVMDRIPKIVFSRTLKNIAWDTATLSTRAPEEEIAALRQQEGGNILVGSRSLIIHLMNQGLIDELQLCIHPVIAGGGLPLFEHIANRTQLNLLRTQTFKSGAVVHFYNR